MAIWKRHQQGTVGAASADQIDPERTPDLAPAAIDGDRGIPPVNQRSYQSRAQLFAIGGAVALMVGLMWMVNRSDDKPPVAKNDPMATKEQRFDEGRSNSSGLAPPVIPPAAAAPVYEPPKPPSPEVEPIQVVPRIDGKAAPAGAGGNRTKELSPLEKRMRSKTVIFEERAHAGTATASAQTPATVQAIPGLPGLYSDGSARPVGLVGASLPPTSARSQPATTSLSSSVVPTTTAASALPPIVSAPSAPEPGGTYGGGGPISDPRTAAASGDDGVGQILRPTRLDGASATKFPDRTLMMARGKLIDCVLDTAISTVVAGMTKCSLTRDVYSEDGRVVLLDRGTELTGEYRSNLRTGQTRLGIVWVRAKTPAGVVIELSSPATDSLGRAGVDGHVERHFWERYGAAILLSALDDALAIIANRASSDQSVYIPPNTTYTGREAAAVALENNIRIPPTIVKNQGEHIAVFVARDLDFRSVYGYRSAPSAVN